MDEVITTGIMVGAVHVLSGPERLAAMATLCGMDTSSENKNSRCGNFLTGLKWGLGHSLSLSVIGGVLIALSNPAMSKWIEVDEQWTILTQSLVGVFMLMLGAYGLHTSCRNRKERVLLISPNTGRSLKLSSQDISSLDSSEVSDISTGGASLAGTNDVSCGTGRDTLANMMRNVLDQDEVESVHSHNSLADLEKELSKSKQNNEDQYLTDLDKYVSSSGGLSESFTKYKERNKPRLKRASSMLRIYADPKKSISKVGSERLSYRKCHISKASMMSVVAGLVQGAASAANPIGVLAVIPVVQLQNARVAATYLGVFSLTSTLVMGLFASLYGCLCEWMTSSGSKQQGSATTVSRLFMVEIGSSSLSIAVGALWALLLSVGAPFQ